MQISAFVDGELPDNEADLLLRRMGQDAELRQTVADYLAIGRAMRGEASFAGVDRIHERVVAELDDKPLAEPEHPTDTARGRSVRPLAGFAVAAAVALLAIFGLQQTTAVNDTEAVSTSASVGDTAADTDYTAEGISDQLRQYYLSHGATATENGANGMNTRFVTLRMSDEALDEGRSEPADETAAEEDDAMPTTP